MKYYAINASPRKNWNTATILSKVLEGVTMHDENSYTEMINLYNYCYKGCISYFQCKKNQWDFIWQMRYKRRN